MKTSKKSIFQLVLFLLIAAGLIYWQYSILSPEQFEEIKQAIVQTKWLYLCFALIVGFLSHLFRSLRWRLMLDAVGYTTKAGNTTAAVLLGYLANTLVPRLGEIARCSSLVKTEKIPFEKSLGTVISERAFDVLCLLVVFLMVFTVEYQLLADYGQQLLSMFLYQEDGSFKTIQLLLVLFLGVLGFASFWYLLKKSKNNKIQGLLKNLIEGLKSIIRLKQKTLFLIYTIGIWSMYVLMVWIALKAVPATEHLSWSAAMAITAFGSIAIILTPGGIGAYPPVAAGILWFYKIQESAGLALGWVSWTMQTVVVVILGIMALLYISLVSPSNKINDDTRRNAEPDF